LSKIENIKMLLKKISLQDFRNYKKRTFNFSPGVNLVVGPNTLGKTNLLETIYLLSSGDSFRAKKIEEMVAHDEQVAHVVGTVEVDREILRLSVVLTRGIIEGKRVPLRQFFLNNVKKSKMSFIGNFLAVIFRPEDLEIVIDSPAIRRDFLDDVLNQADREYYRAHLSYRKGLRSRNKILENIRERKTSTRALFFWDRLLVENGELITKKREEFINFLNDQEDAFGKLEIFYQKNLVSLKRLEEKRNIEIAAAMTLVGPHRDDFSILGNNGNLSVYGSRGEQRLAVLWLRLGQLEFLRRARSKQPVLLLDDIFSELDGKNRRIIFEAIEGNQVIITSTDEFSLGRKMSEEMKIMKL